MKLSDLILKGCEMVPRQSYGLYVEVSAEQIVSACAFGTAAVAYEGLGHRPWVYKERGVKLAEALDDIAPGMSHAVMTKNDRDAASREAIALWLRDLGL